MTVVALKECLSENGSSIAWMIVLIASLVQIAPIKINPWSWLLGKIGNMLNADVKTEYEKLSKDVQRIQSDFWMQMAKEARYRILRFDDEILQGHKHSKEHFDEMLGDIDVYERYCVEHPEFPNNKCVLAIAHIKAVYANNVNNQSFL